MSSRIILYEDLQEDAMGVVAAAVPEVLYRPARPGERASLSLTVVTFEGGVRIHSDLVRDSLVAHIAETLARDYSPVHVYRVEVVPGTNAKEIDASETIYDGGKVRVVDMSRDAAQLAEELLEGAPTDDVVDDELAHSLIQVLPPDGDAPELIEDLHFVARFSGRLLPIANALASGANWEWMDLHGQRALRVTREGEAQISVLSDDEIAELGQWLER